MMALFLFGSFAMVLWGFVRAVLLVWREWVEIEMMGNNIDDAWVFCFFKYESFRSC